MLDAALLIGLLSAWLWAWWPSWDYALGLVVGAVSAASLTALVGRLRVARREARRVEQLEAERRERSAAQHLLLDAVAHELRTPVQGVLGATGLLLDGELDGAQTRECALTIRSSAERWLAAFNQLLELADLEADSEAQGSKKPVELGACDVRRVVEDVAELLTEEATRRGLELVVHVAGDVPHRARADEGTLRRLLSNLVACAAKVAEGGEVCCKVTAAPLGGGSLALDFEVSAPARAHSPPPAGQGPPDWQPRAELERAIAERLARRLGVKLLNRSDPRRGACTRFRLPVEVLEREDPDLPALPSPLKARPVLVVDTSAASRDALAQTLQSWGAEVEDCGTAASAMARLMARRGGTRPYAAVLVDAAMTGDLGAPLTARLVTTNQDTATRVLALARDRAQAEALVHQEGLAAVLTKPVRRRQLLLSLCEAEKRAPSAPPSLHPGPLHSRPPGAPAQRARARILVADDDQINQRVLCRLLQNQGYRCDVVGDGVEALAALRAVPYDAVLMDGDMPTMGGIEATRRWRAEEPTGCRVPILAVTASARDEDARPYLAAGMDALLTKPLSPARLAQALEAHVRSDRRDPEGFLRELARRPAVEPARVRRLCQAVPEASEMGYLLHMVETFGQFGPRHAKALRSAIHDRDATRASAAADALRALADGVGAGPLAALAERAEDAARAGQWHEARTLAAAARGELERARDALATAQDQLVRRSGVTRLTSSAPPRREPGDPG